MICNLKHVLNVQIQIVLIAVIQLIVELVKMEALLYLTIKLVV